MGGSRGPKPSDRTPLRTPAATDLPLTLVVAPAFFGISVPAESRAEAEGARPTPSGANLQPSPSIPAREAVEQTAGAGNALCACARSGGSGPVAYTSALPQERHLLAGGSKTPRRPLILDRGSGQQEMGSWARILPRREELGVQSASCPLALAANLQIWTELRVHVQPRAIDGAPTLCQALGIPQGEDSWWRE